MLCNHSKIRGIPTYRQFLNQTHFAPLPLVSCNVIYYTLSIKIIFEHGSYDTWIFFLYFSKINCLFRSKSDGKFKFFKSEDLAESSSSDLGSDSDFEIDDFDIMVKVKIFQVD